MMLPALREFLVEYYSCSEQQIESASEITFDAVKIHCCHIENHKPLAKEFLKSIQITPPQAMRIREIELNTVYDRNGAIGIIGVCPDCWRVYYKNLREVNSHA